MREPHHQCEVLEQLPNRRDAEDSEGVAEDGEQLPHHHEDTRTRGNTKRGL